MIAVELIFDDPTLNTIPENIMAGFSYTVRLESMYAVAKVSFKDLSKEFFNKIKIGQKVTVRFFDTEDSSLAVAQLLTYDNPMRVLKTEKNPSTHDSLIDIITLELISEWYYIAKVQTSYYFGSVSTIISSVLNENFKGLGYTFDCETSTDRPKSRYQIQERPQAFIERLLKKGMNNGYPMCLYTDHKSTVHLKAYSTIINNEKFYLATVLGTDTLLNSATADFALGYIPLAEYQVIVNPTFTARQAVHTVSHYHSSESYPKTTILHSFEGVEGLNGKKNIQVADLSPVKSEITSWSDCPHDARAEFLSKYWHELTHTFTVTCVTPSFQVNSVQVGNVVRLELPFNPVQNSTTGEEVNFAEGGYIIDSVSYILTPSSRQTAFTMFQVRF